MTVIEQRITDTLTNQLRVERTAIGPNVSFAALNIDSLVLVELALLLGDEFGVAIEDGELRTAMTIGAVADLIAAKSTAR